MIDLLGYFIFLFYFILLIIGRWIKKERRKWWFIN